jgi:hypothetical protein
MTAGRPCKVCAHPNRVDIDASLIAGAALTGIAANYGMSPQSLLRHRDRHIPTEAQQKAAQAVAAGESLHGAGLMLKAAALLQTAETILEDAMTSGQPETALRAIREAGRMVELCAKLTGDLDASTTINLTLAPQWVTLQTTILQALAPHPEARSAVVAALERVQ